MRKNCQRTLLAWFQDKPFGKQGDSIWTDGDTIYSYNTWIVNRDYSVVCEDPWWSFDGVIKNGRAIWRCRKCSDYWCANASTRFLFNATKYSKTTTTHQDAIRAYLGTRDYHLKVHDKVPMGTA